MSKGYKDEQEMLEYEDEHNKTLMKLKKNISNSGTMKTKSEYEEDDASSVKQYDDKKLSKLAKISMFLRKSFIGPQKEPVSRFSDLKDRTVWTFFMLFGFIGFISAGNFYCALLVFIVITTIFSELIDMSKYREINQDVKYYYLINWYNFFLCIYYSYIRILHSKLTYLIHKYIIISYILNYHTFICFMLYCLGFLIFILSLERKHYKYQFKSFAWNHIVLAIFMIQSSLIVDNIFKGLVWFILPAILVICNDISAYIFGRMFGKHMLSTLSPKKTWEGAIGAFISTMIFSLFISDLILKFDYLICPVKEIHIYPFHKNSCDTSQLTKDVSFTLTVPFLSSYVLTLKQLQIHGLFLGLFSSLIAPFGGLFASGFKRAVKIKDFANTIPGHGGLTDRMDCQMLMGTFTSLWINNFTFSSSFQRLEIVTSMINALSPDYKYKVWEYLNATLSQP